MTTVKEAVSNSKTTNSPMAALLDGGMRQLSLDQVIQFELYQRYIFPLDGMNYIIKILPGAKSSTVTLEPSPINFTRPGHESIQIVPGNVCIEDIVGGYIVNPLSAEDQGLLIAEPLIVSLTASRTDKFILNPGEQFNIPENPEDGVWVSSASGNHYFTVVLKRAVSEVGNLPLTFKCKCSLHVAVETEQEEDSSLDINTVILNTETEIRPFNDVGPDQIYIGSYGDIRFSFSSRRNYYDAANVYHYMGEAVYAMHGDLVIDDPSTFSPTLIVSNSLPIWLGMSGYVPPYRTGFRCPFPLYPSYLVSDNFPPPYGAVHIEDTISLADAPIFSPRNSQSQLCRDEVKITFYGADNEMSETFLAFVEQYSRDWNKIGMANMPVVSDEKRIQSELNIISKKKSISFNVNYLQGVARDEARQLIEHWKINFIPSVGRLTLFHQ